MKYNLVLSNGSIVKIDKIEREKLLKPQTRYNFEVEDFHTYYVTQKDVLVHNMCEKTYADYFVKYNENNKIYIAYHQMDGPYKNLFLAKDNYGHGGSKFKLLKEVSGKKLKLLCDIDENGVKMLAKHSSNFNNTYKYWGKKIL